MNNWINESIFYHIYPLGFCDAPEYNDCNVTYRLEKLNEYIPHLKSINVNALYIGPLFDSSKHGYDTKDYYKVDTRLGDNESFKKTCELLHANGIKVVLDGVFNHVGREFWAFKDVQQNLQNSRYCGWFENLNFGGNSPMGDPFWYEGWSGHYDLVKLNLKNPEVVEHIFNAVSMWIDEFKIDGLRLDVAEVIDIDFLKSLRHFCTNKKSDFWLMGEIIHGNYARLANPDTLHSVTNYECYKGIYSSFNDHNFFEIAHSFNRQFSNGGIYKDIYTYNFIDNHDVNRIADTVKNKNTLSSIYTMLYTMPGVPSVYYGSEWGIGGTRTNNNDKSLRPCITLGQIPNADNELCSFISKLGYVRKQLDGIKYGEFENIVIKNEQLVYRRFTNSQSVYISFNVNDNEQWVGFNVTGGNKLTDALTGEVFDCNGYANIPLRANSSRILVLHNGEFTINAQTPCEAQEIETTQQENICEVVKNEEVEKIVLPLSDVTVGRYRHFKGEEYEVIGIAKDSETLEELVVYEAMYGEHSLWVRSKAMFSEVVEIDGKKVNRFIKLS